MKALAYSAYVLAAVLLVGLTALAHREEHPVGCICPRHRGRKAA